ncbi:drug/metabolite transporter (DMT)-like permease [Variovorax boronicumulans]|uniref:Drug/metabolite transporter (DMT)-like permease n=1 Tax=Variovorax boronicumulans TaxID=436515 RepID=A0AAW8CTH5_9BURK|nr:DMT family transporter [Variovorax boronicumulans]MDP9891012.1 drug/metabolite transporter (DMT)-like permease [Variovorax boronicumulans]MDQ0036023.1 drug/metabolite transporter (DMT)-like permease [Variovorax boronicumulans]MDQ0051079.1 drug/metabolite transporter (DMT)-like permease [Variovorax boronicumulans]
MRLTHGGAVWLMVVVTLMWGTAGVVTRHLTQAHSFEITFWRSLFTMLALLVILPLWRGRAVFSQLRSGGRELWISGVCWAVMFTAFMVALTMASTASVLVTMSLGPLLTALAARIFIGHRLPARTWVAIVVAGLGIGWMYGTQLMQGGAGGASLLGTLVALCVPLAGATNWTVVQHAHAKGHDIDLVPAVLIGAVLTALFTLPFALPLQASAHDLGLLAFLGVFQLAIPCVLSVLCAQVLKAPEAALLALLEVIFGIALAWLGAGEEPAASVLTGGALVIGALVFNELLALRGRRTTAADTALPGAH